MVMVLQCYFTISQNNVETCFSTVVRRYEKLFLQCCREVSIAFLNSFQPGNKNVEMSRCVIIVEKYFSIVAPIFFENMFLLLC